MDKMWKTKEARTNYDDDVDKNKIKRMKQAADEELMVVVKSVRRRYTQMIWKMYKMRLHVDIEERS